MKKRVIAVMLATTMAIGMVACGDDAGSDTKESVASESTDAKTEAEESEEEVEATGVSFPLEEQITIQVASRRMDGYTPYEETVFMKELEEITNINVEWLDWTTSVYDEKKSLMFSTGDIPDAVYGSWLMTGTELVKYAEQGYFYPLNELVEAGVMPNYKEVLDMRPSMKLENTAPDGNIYNIPHINELSKGIIGSDTVLMNTEWLDAVGKEMPTTTDELYEVLLAFKEAKDINGNGAYDEVPMSCIYGNTGWNAIVGWFGTALSGGISPVVQGDELIFAQATDDYKDALIFFHKLYSEGLLDQEIFTIDSTTYDARNTAQPYSVGVATAWNENWLNGTESDVYQYLPPLASNNGKEPQWYTPGFSYASVGFIMSADCEYPEETAAWVDLMLGEEAALKSFFGYPEYLEEVEDGLYRVPWVEGVNTAADKSWYAPITAALYMVLVPERYDTYEWNDFEANKIEANDVYGDYLNPEGAYLSSWFTTQDEADELAILDTDIKAYVDQMAADFISQGGIEEGWDAYLAQLEKLNVDRMLEIKQGIYNRNTGK